VEEEVAGRPARSATTEAAGHVVSMPAPHGSGRAKTRTVPPSSVAIGCSTSVCGWRGDDRTLYSECGLISRKFGAFFAKCLVLAQSTPSTRPIQQPGKAVDMASVTGLGISHIS
jgi:hypothetical protein